MVVGCLSDIHIRKSLEYTGGRERNKRTRNGMAVERLYLVLCRRHSAHKFSDAFGALERLSVPCQSGRGAVQVRKGVDAGAGIVNRVVETGELVRCPSRNFDAGGNTDVSRSLMRE